MLHELFYTSAPNTFDGPGYGVVGRTHGFPPQLEKFVRQISHYDFLSSPGGGAESANPPAFSHLMFNDSGQRWHVLSRIGFGGYDDSNRAVFLAHHVAVPEGDLLAGNPARLMQETSLFYNSWNGDAREIAPRDFRRRLSRPATAAVWERLTGDRNWSAAWLEKYRTHAGESCFLVVPADVDVLALFSETLALLPEAEAWKVTFSTYLRTGQAPAQIDWGALIDGTPAAAQFRARYPDRVLQVTKSLGRAPVTAAPDVRRRAGPFQEAASPDDEIVVTVLPDRRDIAAGNFQRDWSETPAHEEYVLHPAAGSRTGSKSARGSADQSTKQSPAALPLPPPPPPQSTGILSQPYVFGAAFFLVALVGILIWGSANAKLTKLEDELNATKRDLEESKKDLAEVRRSREELGRKLKKAEEGRQEPQQDLAAANEELKKIKQTLKDTEEKLAEAKKKSPSADEHNKTKEQPVATGAPVGGAPVIYIQHGLRAALKAQKDLMRLDRAVSGHPKLEFSPHPDPNFALQHVAEQEEIVVSLPNDSDSKLRLRLDSQEASQVGGKLRLVASWDAASNNAGSKNAILDRLYLSYLDIVGDAADEKGQKSRVRVAFNPRLKPLKFEPAAPGKGKNPKQDSLTPSHDPTDDDTLQVLKMLAKLQLAKGRVRVDGIALAGQPIAWRLKKALEEDFDKLITFDIFKGKTQQWVNIRFELRLTESSALPVVKAAVRDYPNEIDGEPKQRKADPECKLFADLLGENGELHGSVLIKYRNNPVPVPILQFANSSDP